MKTPALDIGTLSVLVWGLGFLSSAGCSGPRDPQLNVVLRDASEIVSRVPDVQTDTAKVWFAERTRAVGVYYVELAGSVPLRFRPKSALRIVVLGGRMKIRVGARERTIGPGAYVSIPPRVGYRIRREGKAKLLYAAMLSPDSHAVEGSEGSRLLKAVGKSSS